MTNTVIKISDTVEAIYREPFAGLEDGIIEPLMHVLQQFKILLTLC